MLLRKQCDTEGVDFDDTGDGLEIYVCAERQEDGKIQLYEQIEGVDKEGPHSITRKVIVDKEFVKKLNDKLQ